MSVTWWWAILSIALGTYSSNFILKNPLASITFLYTTLSAVSVLALNKYPSAPDSIQQVLMCTSIWAVISFVSVSVIARKMVETISSDWFSEILYGASIINSGLVIFNAVFMPISIGNHGYTGFIVNASMNGCLIALGAGPAIKGRAWTGLFLITIAVTLSLSSMPIGVLFISTVSYLFCLYRAKELLKYVAGICAVLLVCGLISSGMHLFDSASRFTAYKIFMTEWWERGMIFFGTGLGTFQVMSPQMQAKHGFMLNAYGVGHFWQSMHSDWLECLFQLGVFGLFLYLALFYFATKNLYQKKEAVLFSVLSGIGAMALFNYPTKYWVFGVMSVYAVLKSEEPKYRH